MSADIGINKGVIDSQLTLFTGTDDSRYTRKIARWLEKPYVTIR